MKKIVLFYKRIIEPGGAERLLVHEFLEFRKLGYDVDLVSFEIHEEALFGVSIPNDNKIILGSRWLPAMWNLVTYAFMNRSAYFLCASGHLEMLLLKILVGTDYSLHIHHPSFMSFNETDKYSVFQRAWFRPMLKSNFGASRFEEIRKRLSFINKVHLNLRAAWSILAIRKARIRFVLSEYARREKKILFGVDCHVLCGALEKKALMNLNNAYPIKNFNGTPILLTVCRLDENKRIDELLRAFSFLLPMYPDALLLIGGRGPTMEGLKKLSQSLGVAERVNFLGFIPDEILSSYYALADLFVSLDWADYRITMYEALAEGTKVLLSDETDADPFLLKGGYLHICSPNAKLCAEAIQRALSISPKIDRYQLERYLSKFTWSEYCRKIAKSLESEDSYVR